MLLAVVSVATYTTLFPPEPEPIGKVGTVSCHWIPDTGSRQLIFFARSQPKAGHAFIGLYQKIGQRCRVTPFGFYPRFKVQGYDNMITGIKGEIRIDDIHSAQVIARMPISDAQHRRINRKVSDWISSDERRYVLVTTNCVEFVRDIAKALGLSTRARYEKITPTAFVNALIQDNKGVLAPVSSPPVLDSNPAR